MHASWIQGPIRTECQHHFPIGIGGQRQAKLVRSSGEIHALIRQAREKIGRIRGGQATFMPDSAAPLIKRTQTVDRWSRGLGIAAAVLGILTVLSFTAFWIILSSGVTRIS